MTGIRTKLICVGERNQPIGEDHPRTRLSNADVDDIRTLFEEEDWTLHQLFVKYGSRVSLGGLNKIVHYQRRTATMMGSRRVPILEG